MLRAPADHLYCLDATRRNSSVTFEELRIAEDGVERCAQLMAQADHVPALRLAGCLGDLLGLLQLGVGALVRLDLVHQEIGLPPRLLLGDPATVLRQDEQPGGHAGNDGQDEEDAPERRFQNGFGRVRIKRDLEIDQREHGADDAAEQKQHAKIASDIAVEWANSPLRKRFGQQTASLARQPSLRLAAVATASLE